MDPFMSIHRKDYLWPHPAKKPGTTHTDAAKPPCVCGHSQGASAEDEKRQWSRSGPMGTVIEPKLFPPLIDASRYDSPAEYMELLLEHYPQLYKVLETSAPEELVKRVNQDRLRSSYMMSYCHEEEFPTEDYTRQIEAAKAEGAAPCPPRRGVLPSERCPPNERSILFRPATISKEIRVPREPDGGGQCESAQGTYSPAASEYQDIISHLGALIIRDRLHGHGKAPRTKD